MFQAVDVILGFFGEVGEGFGLGDVLLPAGEGFVEGGEFS